MNRLAVVLVTFLFFLISCGNPENGAAIYSQPPYDKLTDSIRVSPSNADLYYRRGSLFYSNQLFPYAEQDIRKAWQLDPKEEYALSLTTILKEKSADSAIQFLQGALQKVPNSIALKIGLARGYEKKGETDKALAVCDGIIRQYPNQLDALSLKSDLLKEENKNAEALATLAQAYSYAPFDKELAYNYAYDLASAKDPRALRLCDSLIRADSTETVAKAYYVRGTYFAALQQPSEALRNFDASIDRDYTFMDAYLDKGTLLYNQKEYARALATFNLALKVSPTTGEFYFWKGKCEEALHENVEAKADYERAYGLDKSLTEAKEAADKLK